MIRKTAQSFHPAVLLLLPAVCQSTAVDIPPWPKHTAASRILSPLFSAAIGHPDNAICDDAQTNAHTSAIDFATSVATFFFQRDTGASRPPQTAIKEAVLSVAKNKLCTPSKKFISPTMTLLKPTPPAGITINPCDSGDLETAVVHYQSNKNTFTKASFKSLFPSCANCELEGFISSGQTGVVFLVKVGSEKRAMKVTACGQMQPEIYAQQKIAGASWAIKMHSWGRSAGDRPKWEYYIMDLIGATVEKSLKNAVSSKQIKEVMRLTLEAARDLRTKYNLAHTDLKSDNVAFMRDERKTIKLFDFGLVTPITDANSMPAYLDYWRVFESINDINVNLLQKSFGNNEDPAKSLFKILEDEAAKQILDGKPFAEGKNDFPRKAFFDTYLHNKVMDEFAKLGWIDKKAIGKPDTALDKLFTNSKLPAMTAKTDRI